MTDYRKGSVPMVDDNGDSKSYRRCSGPLRAGKTVVRIEAIQTAELDEKEIESLKLQFESFLATLNGGFAIPIPDDILAQRLLEQTVPETFGRLLKSPSGYSYWMIRAWIAEALYLLGRLPNRHPERPTLRLTVQRLNGWFKNLNFDHDDADMRPGSDADWAHVAVYSRQQAELVRRLESSDYAKPARSRDAPQPLFARLKRHTKSGGSLFLLGGKEDAELLDACVACVGPSVEWLACKPNDTYQADIRKRLTSWDAIGVMLMPAVDPLLAADLTKFCQACGLACVVLERTAPEDLEAALQALENKLKTP